MFNSASYWGNANQNYTEILLQIKTTLRYCFTAVKMAIIKKSTNNKCWKGCEEKGILLHCVGGNVNWYSDYGEQYEGFLKIKYRATI